MHLNWQPFLFVFLLVSMTHAAEPQWQRVQLDAHFRSEGVSVADLNNDGKPDVVAGDVWYAAPNWERHEFRPVGDFWAGDGYSNSFCNWTYNINGDGWQDIIVVGFPGAKFHWYENPKNAAGHWAEHVIHTSICNETPQFKDVTGDGRPDIVLGSQPERQMGYLEIPKPEESTKPWKFVPISEAGDPNQNGTFMYYHGLGVTDVNADGLTDVVIPHGWWEHPKTLTGDLWTFHPHRLAAQAGGNPQTGADIYAEDFDMDGDVDLVMSCAHQYGIWWYENTGTAADGSTTYVQHEISKKFSQTHALLYVDVNGDGQKDLVTGKRFYAHNGGDPGANDSVGLYWYEVHRQKGSPPQFIEHEILAARDTGIGTQFTAADFNGDGKIDFALANKKGVNIILQK